MTKTKEKTNGLSEKQANERLAKYGENVLEGKRGRSAVGIFLSQFKDALLLILAAAALISVLFGQLTEAISIIAILVLNAFMGFIQEYRTEKTLQSLKEMTAPVARVYRDGEFKTIAASQLVPDDVISLQAGDRIPADCVLLESAGVKTDEAILTGESATIAKQANLEAHNKLFMGTSIVAGHGLAQVLKTGMHTEMGGIASLIDDAKEEPTPLQIRLAALGKFIAVTCLLCGLAVIVIGLWRRDSTIFDLFLTGISLAVAAIPEGLPAIVTIVLALSVNRILSRGAIIRKLHAVETLGSASIICSDKTGTITENKMTVTNLYCMGNQYSMSGGGLSARGSLMQNNVAVKVGSNETLKAALICGTLCTTASIAVNGDQLVGDGSPTEVALLCAAYKCGIRREALVKEFRLLDEKPFDSGRKMMSVHVKRGDARIVMVKGAPDIILSRCSHISTGGGIRTITSADKKGITKEIETMANDAQRVIAVAVRNGAFQETDLTFLALFGMKDPPRKEVKAAVRTCRLAGIKPVMITGDHAATARAIAREVGILQNGDRIIEGEELDGMDDDTLRKAVRNTAVFARVSPKHKLRIVRAYKQNNHIVAMTGDGVNDAPAIKEADIGVAMGISGSDVTKEASSVVILDDNFATIVAAVEEGRIIYQNIRRFIRFLLTSNLGEVITVLLAMVLGLPPVFLPIQILLINLVTDGLPAIALGMEPAEKDIMKQKPRPENESLFAGGLTGTILFRGAILGLCNILCYIQVFRMSGDLVLARSAAYITLIIAQMIHVLECKLEGGWRNANFFGNRTLVFAIFVSIAVTFAVVYLPPLQAIFQTTAVTGRYLLPMLGCIVLSPILGFISGKIQKKEKNV